MKRLSPQNKRAHRSVLKQDCASNQLDKKANRPDDYFFLELFDEELLFRFEEDFLPPPLSLFTVAQARAAAVLLETPFFL